MNKLRPATLIVGVFAVLLAAGGAVVVRQMLQQVPQPEAVTETAPEPVKKIYVPLAATGLAAGRKITAGDVANRSFTPSDYAKSKYSTTLHITQSSQIIGRVLDEPLKAGSVFAPDSFFSEGTGPTVAHAVPYGKRAVTVEITGSGFVDGFATPGTLVDVLFRSSKSELEEIPETTVTILHAIKVLAVNSQSYPNTRPVDEVNEKVPESVKVTLAVAPGEVNKLKALEGRGELSLALRSEDELGPDQLQAQFEAANRALKNVSTEYQALRSLKELSERGEVASFDKGDRLLELVELVPAAEAKVNLLKTTIAAQNAAQEPNRQTLAEVLDVDSQRVTVALAASDLRPDRLIRPGDLQMLEITPDEAREQGYSVVLDDEPAQLVGRTLRVAVGKGQVVASDLFYPEGVRPGVAERLPHGFRAVTVTLNRESFADGYAAPETDVDVFFRAEGLQDVPETTLMVLEGLTVLAVDGSVYPFPGAAGDEKEETDAVKVTLAVPVEAVGRIKALVGRGEITLALRSSEERSPLTIHRELADAKTDLEKARLEADAFSQLRQIAGSRGLEQSQNNRLRTLKQIVPELEDRIALLQVEQSHAKKLVPDVTLAEILGIQAPAPPIHPASIEVYQGGQHKTMILPEQPGTYRTASQATQPVATSGRPEIPIRTDKRPRRTTDRSAAQLRPQVGAPVNPAPDTKQISQPSSDTSEITPAADTSASATAPQGRQSAKVSDPQAAKQASQSVIQQNALQQLKPIYPPAPAPPVAPFADVMPRRVGSADTVSLELAEAMLKTNRDLARMVAELESRLRDKTAEGQIEQAGVQSVAPQPLDNQQPASPAVVPEPLLAKRHEPYPLYFGGSESSGSQDGSAKTSPEIARFYKATPNESTIELYLGGTKN